MPPAGAHFFWGAVMYGYLLYDTAYTLAFWSAVGSPSFLVHHAVGLAACTFGLYYNKCAPGPFHAVLRAAGLNAWLTCLDRRR